MTNLNTKTILSGSLAISLVTLALVGVLLPNADEIAPAGGAALEATSTSGPREGLGLQQTSAGADGAGSDGAADGDALPPTGDGNDDLVERTSDGYVPTYDIRVPADSYFSQTRRAQAAEPANEDAAEQGGSAQAENEAQTEEAHDEGQAEEAPREEARAEETSVAPPQAPAFTPSAPEPRAPAAPNAPQAPEAPSASHTPAAPQAPAAPSLPAAPATPDPAGAWIGHRQQTGADTPKLQTPGADAQNHTIDAVTVPVLCTIDACSNQTRVEAQHVQTPGLEGHDIETEDLEIEERDLEPFGGVGGYRVDGRYLGTTPTLEPQDLSTPSARLYPACGYANATCEEHAFGPYSAETPAIESATIERRHLGADVTIGAGFHENGEFGWEVLHEIES